MNTVAGTDLDHSASTDQTLKILLVEDDHWMADFVMSLLTKYPEYVVIRMPNGMDAFRYLSNNKVDLILTDILMPEMDGIELIQKGRQLFGDTPVIAFSGGGFRLDQTELLKYAQIFGAKRVLGKPVEPQVLLDAIQSALAEREK